MTKWLSLALVLALACAQPSCSVFQQQKHTEGEEKEEETAKIPPPLHLGAVHQVIPERHFALLRIIGPMPKEGTVLISHPADGAIDRVGNLMVSSGQHRRGNIIVADIRSGTVIIAECHRPGFEIGITQKQLAVFHFAHLIFHFLAAHTNNGIYYSTLLHKTQVNPLRAAKPLHRGVSFS